MEERLKGLHITHIDGDGVGCAIVGLLNTKYDYTTYCCNTGNANNNASNALRKHITDKNWSSILISDVSIDDDTADYVDKYCKDHNISLLMVDHHPTNKLSEKYDWVKMAEPVAGRPISAAAQLAFCLNDQTKYRFGYIDVDSSGNRELFVSQTDNTSHSEPYPEYINYFNCDHNYNKPKFNVSYSVIISDISRYDTWEWKKHPSNDGLEDLTTILLRQYKKYTAANLAQHIINNIETCGCIFNEHDKELINQYRNDVNKGHDENASRCKLIKFNGYRTIAFVSENMNISMFQEYVKERVHDEFDIIMGLEASKRLISLRTPKDDIDLGAIAKLYNGGGHKQAAGASNIDPEAFCNILLDYYRGKDITWKE